MGIEFRPEPGEPDPLESDLLGDPSERTLDGRIVIKDWAGGIAQERAEIPSVRFRSRWVSTAWLLPIVVVGLVVAIAVAQQLRTYGWMQDFIRDYPGTSAAQAPAVTSGFPWWLRWQHFFNLVFMSFIVRAGLQILADHPRLYLNAHSRPGSEWFRMRGPIPADRRDPEDAAGVWTAKDDAVALPKWLGIPGFRHSIGLARWFHFSFDVFWLVNGLVFYVLLFSTGQWQRLVPQSLDVIPNAISTAIQYASLDFPTNSGFLHYNGLQLIAYFLTVFVAAPLAFLTGLGQAPAVAGRFGLATGVLNRQVMRTVHYLVMTWMVFFIAMHTVMVFVTGLIPNLNHITLGTNTDSFRGLWIYLAWMAVVVLLWLWASPFTIAHPRKVQRFGQLVVGGVKTAMEWWNPKATYHQDDISDFLWPNGHIPDSEEYNQLLASDFVDYRLRVDGLVGNPVELTLEDLRAMPYREQITQHYCIQGWSGIAKWGGVAMADICELVQPDESAKWVVFYSFGEGPLGGLYYDCHPIENMAHDLTILALDRNGEPLHETYGAPLRLRDEVELGFKQVKWIQAIEFVTDFSDLGAGQGGYNEDQEFFGYRMPI
jgi:thiosulfate reductase cytochrome b subunit